MHHNEKFREVVKDKFKCDIKRIYLPNQIYINQLITSLNEVDATDYKQCHDNFISEYKYFKEVGFLESIKEFVEGCLNQLLWINTILESGKVASKEKELEEEFDYITPYMLGNYWFLDKVTKKGVYFRGEEPYQDSRVIINSENIIEIALALYKVEHQYGEYIAAKKNKRAKSVSTSSSKAKQSSLFKSNELEIKCLNVLKEIKHPVLNIDGDFMGESGMKGAIVIWYYYCKKLGFISNEITNTRGAVAKEVMNLIPNLSIEGSSFDKEHKAKKYKDDIEQKLDKFSHK